MEIVYINILWMWESLMESLGSKSQRAFEQRNYIYLKKRAEKKNFLN